MGSVYRQTKREVTRWPLILESLARCVHFKLVELKKTNTQTPHENPQSNPANVDFCFKYKFYRRLPIRLYSGMRACSLKFQKMADPTQSLVMFWEQQKSVPYLQVVQNAENEEVDVSGRAYLSRV